MSAAAHGALARELSAMLAILGGRMIDSTVSMWASGALTGAHHDFLFDCAEAVPPERASRIARYLTERDFALDFDFVADTHLSRTGPGNQLRIEALTLAG